MTESARAAFVDEMNQLEQDLLSMGSMVERMLHKAIEAYTDRNKKLAAEVTGMDDVVDDYNLSIENRCLKLLALQQPMARDLRTIAAILKIITDVERMGDYMVDIAKTAEQLADMQSYEQLDGIAHMAELASRMLREALQAFVNRDLNLIQHMIDDDDEIDRINRRVRTELIRRIQEDPSIAPQAVAIILISRYLERLADHVTNVGERVYYMETGELKELHT